MARKKAESNKPPAGYRWKGDNTLEPIPGGPNDPKTSAAKEPPSGYRWKDDNTLEPIPGGPKDKKNETSQYSIERMDRVIRSIDEIAPQVTSKTAGFGSWLANIPETKARYLRGQLDTLKANIAFNELTQMREASKTGGALGQVSDREGQLLQSALGALDQAMSPDDLKQQLEKIKGSVQRWSEAVQMYGGNSEPDGDRNYPDVGQIEGGYKFLGGNPSDPNNWEKQ